MGIRYCLKKMPDGIYILIQKDSTLVFPVLLEQLMTDLTKRRIPYEPNAVEVAFELAADDFTKLSDLIEGLDHKPIFRIVVTPNKLKAYLIVVPFLNGTNLQEVDILNFLKENRISNGIKNEVIKQVIDNQSEYKEWLIAEGEKTEDGVNAKFIFNFNPRGIEAKPNTLEDGSVDFYNLDLIQSVQAGMVLVEKIPPTPGSDGINVFGEVTKAKPGKDLRLPQGSNTQIIDENRKLIATKDGHVVIVNNKASVLSTYEVKGDVDFSTGNIKYNGNVRIMGHIKNNFTVEASGDVEIHGNLEGTVRSDSNIQIKKGIVKGKAYAKGNIYTRYIENGIAQCDNDIIVADAIMHSITKAGKRVILTGRKGLLVGGTCAAGEEIQATNIGSALGTSTVLEVGIRPEIRDELKEVNKNLALNRENNTKNDMLFNALNAIKQSGGELTGNKSELYKKCCRLQYQLYQEGEDLKARKSELEVMISELDNPRVCVTTELHPGSILFMGKATMNVDDKYKAVIFYLEGLDIKHKPYNEREVKRK